MTKFLLAISLLFACFSMYGQEFQPRQLKQMQQQAREIEEILSFDKAHRAMASGSFILVVQDVRGMKRGDMTSLTPDANFIIVDGSRVTIQVIPRGRGGSIMGYASGSSLKVNKKGDLIYSMNVNDNFYSRRVTIVMPRNSDTATATISSRGGQVRLTGNIYPIRPGALK